MNTVTDPRARTARGSVFSTAPPIVGVASSLLARPRSHEGGVVRGRRARDGLVLDDPCPGEPEQVDAACAVADTHRSRLEPLNMTNYRSTTQGFDLFGRP